MTDTLDDCQMQPLDLSCPISRQRRLTHQSSDLEEEERLSDNETPRNLTMAKADSPEPHGPSKGPARKRFLTKYLHKDRGRNCSKMNAQSAFTYRRKNT